MADTLTAGRMSASVMKVWDGVSQHLPQSVTDSFKCNRNFLQGLPHFLDKLDKTQGGNVYMISFRFCACYLILWLRPIL